MYATDSTAVFENIEGVVQEMRVKGYPRSWWQDHFKKPQDHFKKPLLRYGLNPTHMKYLNTLIVPPQPGNTQQGVLRTPCVGTKHLLSLDIQ